MDLKGQRVAILGAGASGLAAAALALQHGAVVSAFDSGDPSGLEPAAERFSAIGVELVRGDAALVPPHRYDLVVVSPGIDVRFPIAAAFAGASDELIGEIELAFRYCDAPVVAVTGTNGKTTTTGLVADMLSEAGLLAVAAGNIGLPFSEVVSSGVSYDWIVLELSSFQLETISSFRPKVAVWMNFAPDHMDRYESVDDYRNAKLRIFENLAPDDLAVYKHESALDLPGPAVTFSAFSDDADLCYRDGQIRESASSRTFDFSACRLHGKHNAENVMVALAVADYAGIGWERAAEAIRSFTPPPHRCEKIATVDGVLYINDSKATNLHALESALAGQEQPVILIVGGKDKGLDFSEIVETASGAVRHAVCIGEIAGEIREKWSGRVPCSEAASLDDAVRSARDAASEGDVVLFSPGTSSFDMFSNFEERGEAFRRAVTSLGKA
ncbi:MAG: UDP-N-acetylmuramoyl-L-alanine--D-glutamate ligase [Verrucomicrobiales bacterium]